MSDPVTDLVRIIEAVGKRTQRSGIGLSLVEEDPCSIDHLRWLSPVQVVALSLVGRIRGVDHVGMGEALALSQAKRR